MTPLYDGKVIAVQVYPRRDDDGRASFESLLIKRDGSWRAKLDGTVERLAQPELRRHDVRPADAADHSRLASGSLPAYGTTRMRIALTSG